jgi:thiamine pyrophosphokinase
MQTILIQFDTDAQPSVFDRVVAVDAGVNHLFSYAGVTPQTVTPSCTAPCLLAVPAT